MATQTDDIITQAVDAALANVERYALEEFQKLQADPERKKLLIQAAKEAAEEEMRLAGELRTRPSEDMAEHLSKQLPKHRVQLIETGLQVPTYRLDISKKDDGHHWADITRDGKKFMEPRKLTTLAAVNETSWIQMASVIVEAVLLVLQAVGIKVAVSERAIARTAEEIIPVIENSSQLQRAVRALQEAAGRGSNYEAAKAIFNLIKESYSANILWQIIKGLCNNMSAWDWAKTVGIVTAMIVAAVATEGIALIAKIVLALNSAYDFIKKLTNLGQLDALK